MDANTATGATPDGVESDNSKNAEEKTRTWCVYHLIHIHTPYRYIPKLFIEKVPESVCLSQTDWLEESGYEFGEFGIPWANHEVCLVSEAPSTVKGAYRRGDTETIEYIELDEIV